jgi:hypothetical protein
MIVPPFDLSKLFYQARGEAVKRMKAFESALCTGKFFFHVPGCRGAKFNLRLNFDFFPRRKIAVFRSK